ncbi:MAG: hypothetical protein KTR23_03545 [Rhodospirillales bacterium]|nr:hypothetical protein [Rhodospirillales bacterium]
MVNEKIMQEWCRLIRCKRAMSSHIMLSTVLPARKGAGGICKSCQGKPDPELAVKGSKGANIAAGIEAAIEKGEAA